MKAIIDIEENKVTIKTQDPQTCDHTVGQWKRVLGVCDKCGKYMDSLPRANQK